MTRKVLWDNRKHLEILRPVTFGLGHTQMRLLLQCWCLFWGINQKNVFWCGMAHLLERLSCFCLLTFLYIQYCDLDNGPVKRVCRFAHKRSTLLSWGRRTCRNPALCFLYKFYLFPPLSLLFSSVSPLMPSPLCGKDQHQISLECGSINSFRC